MKKEVLRRFKKWNKKIRKRNKQWLKKGIDSGQDNLIPVYGTFSWLQQLLLVYVLTLSFVLLFAQSAKRQLIKLKECKELHSLNVRE